MSTSDFLPTDNEDLASGFLMCGVMRGCYSTICCYPSQGLEAALSVLLPDVSCNPTSGPISNRQGHPNTESTS